jgi:hypothetical protein
LVHPVNPPEDLYRKSPGSPDSITSEGAERTGDEPVSGAPKRIPFKKRVLRFFLILLSGLLLSFFAYRWIGTSTMRGSVQRVYEKDAAYKVEFIEESGDVHVMENAPMRFPHLKLETADLQATLHHLGQTGDVVDLTVWGTRLSWLDIFPNVVDSEFVRSSEEGRAEQALKVTDAVIDELIDQGVVKRGPEADQVRPGVEQAANRALEGSGRGSKKD